MCGIVGYVGSKLALPVLLGGLFSLEYRGYDSAGVVLKEQAELCVFKRVGRINALNNWLKNKLLASSCGIGHTRWATHGEPSNNNSHPHTDELGNVAVVHNGIIENYSELKSELTEQGIVFKSQTDTEVIAHLISLNRHLGNLEAVQAACKRLRGSYALAIVFSDEVEQIIVARKDSPLVIGIGEGENFLASDALALLPYTNTILELSNNEFAIIDSSTVTVYDKAKKIKKAKTKRLELSPESVTKGEHPYFMLKEILEEPDSIKNTLEFLRLNDSMGKIPLHVLTEASNIHIIACGTALHAGMVLKDILERLLRLDVFLDYASEFRYKSPKLSKNSLCIFISQSGETADTLASLELAKECNASTIAITNVIGSTLSNHAEYIIPTRAGPEIAVASTKAYIAQLTAIYVFALHVAKTRGMQLTQYSDTDISKCARTLEELTHILDIEGVVRLISERESLYFIGRGSDYYVALEGALKLKEISYIHCEALPSGELKHGSLALVEPGVVVFCLITQKHLLEKSLNAIHEVKARGGTIVLITQMENINEYADILIKLPCAPDPLMPLLAVLPLQMLAYKTAVKKGYNPDRPRNLAKSVTVE